MEADFRIRHSFWSSLNPFSWTHSSLLLTFILTYLIIMIAYFAIGFLPTSSASALSGESNASSLIIPSVSINASTVLVAPAGDTLPTPVDLVGEYHSSKNKVFLYAHSSSVFKNLPEVNLGDTITFSGAKYIITDLYTQKKEEINMSSLLRAEDTPTLVLMTCVGFPNLSGEYPSRLVVTAEKF